MELKNVSRIVTTMIVTTIVVAVVIEYLPYKFILFMLFASLILNCVLSFFWYVEQNRSEEKNKEERENDIKIENQSKFIQSNSDKIWAKKCRLSVKYLVTLRDEGQQEIEFYENHVNELNVIAA